MTNRTASEQAVIQALQAVANSLEFRDYVETVSRPLPGLQTLFGTPVQPECCMLANQGPVSSTAAPRALSLISALSPISDEEQSVRGHRPIR